MVATDDRGNDGGDRRRSQHYGKCEEDGSIATSSTNLCIPIFLSTNFAESVVDWGKKDVGAIAVGAPPGGSNDNSAAASVYVEDEILNIPLLTKLREEVGLV
nr:hypothetical protein Itr_chr10CG08390 [Ipomoea trifida]